MSSTMTRTNQEINSQGCKIINASQVLTNTLMNENRHHTSARKIKKKKKKTTTFHASKSAVEQSTHGIIV